MIWPERLPKDPDKINLAHVLEMLNTHALSVYEQNCRSANGNIVQTANLLAHILADLIRVNNQTDRTPQQQVAFHDLWAAYGSLFAATNVFLLGYPIESMMILRSALLSVYQAVYYCRDETAFKAVLSQEPLSSKKAVNHAKTVFPKVDHEGTDIDYVGKIWSFLSHNYGHAASAFAYANRTFSSHARDTLKLGPILHTNEDEKEMLDGTGIYLRQVSSQFLMGLRLIYPFLAPIE